MIQEISELIEDAGLTAADPWLGIQFIGDDEVPVTIPATNTKGKYRETGAIYFHFVKRAQAVLGQADDLLARGEVLRDIIRGRRIGSIIIESVTPMNFDQGTTLQFEGGYISGSFIAAYQYDKDL